MAGFIAPLISAIPAIGGLFGGLFGGGGPSKEAQQAMQNLLEAAKMGNQGATQLLGWLNQLQPQAMNLIGRSNELFPTAQNMLENGQTVGGTAGNFLNNASGTFDQAKAGLAPAMDYWTKILAGGKEANQALSPQIQAIQGGYAQARNNLNQFGPQGGGRSALMASLPFQQARDVSNLRATLTPQAGQQINALAGTLGGIGQAQGGIGTNLNSSSNALTASLLSNLMGLGGQLSGQIGSGYGNLFSTGTQANNPIIGGDVGQRLASQGQGGGLGGGIFNILKGLNLGDLFGRNPKATGPSTEYGDPGYQP